MGQGSGIENSQHKHANTRIEMSSFSNSLFDFEYVVLMRSCVLRRICETHFLSATGYSDGYQLKTSLKTPINDNLDRCRPSAFASAEVDIVYERRTILGRLTISDNALTTGVQTLHILYRQVQGAKISSSRYGAPKFRRDRPTPFHHRYRPCCSRGSASSRRWHLFPGAIGSSDIAQKESKNP